MEHSLVGHTIMYIPEMCTGCGRCCERNGSRKRHLLEAKVEGLLYVGKLGELGNVRPHAG